MVDFNVPQKPFFDNQDVSFNIDEIYSIFISEIDKVRSYVNAIDTKVLSTFNDKNISTLISTVDFNSTVPAESRCNAFYRLLGLPVVNDAGEYYSPGFDLALNLDEDLKQKHYNIAQAISSDLSNILNLRERHQKNWIAKFAKQDIDSIALALSSKYLRTINPMKDGIDPLSPDSQSFTINGIDDDIVLKNLKDADGNTPTLVQLGLGNHVIKPFIVDPRIDVTVMPVKNRVAAPFLKSKVDTYIRGTTAENSVYLVRPFIEKICRSRLNIKNDASSLGEYTTSIIDTIKNGTMVKDSDLIDISKDITQLRRSEGIIFTNLIKIIKASINQLFNSIREINRVSQIINWVPIPNEKGPEFGCTLRGILDDDINNRQIEISIQKLIQKKTIDEIEFDVGVTDTDLGNFSFSGIDDMALNYVKSVSKIYNDQISQLTKKRESLGTSANNSLKTIEVIMGNYSGLGLLDILAIYTAMWLVDKKTLIHMLDDAAFERLYNFNPELRSGEVEARHSGETMTGIEVIGNFEKKVVEIYKLMDSLYSDKKNNK